VPYGFTAHAHDLYVDRAMLAEKVRRADLVVTISEFNRRLLVATCGEDARAKVHVIRCGVDPAAFAPAPRRPPAIPTFACVASLRPYKGHEVLLEAVALLRRAGRDLRVVLVGDGERRRWLEARIARAGLGDVVLLRGALPHEQVPAVLAAATALVVPSVTARDGQMEGIPVALMEGMAAGLPVVATRLSGIPELVQDGVTGLLVPERDPAALAAAMERLAADPALAARLAEAGRRAVREQHDLARNVARLRALLTGAASSSPASSARAEAGSPRRGAAG
jgi:glycosyltransferase involved in cell wall biosynthesis